MAFRSKYLFAVASIVAVVGFAEVNAQNAPVTNVNPHFGNLVAAQKEAHNAFTHIATAQRNNEMDFGGHAQKAKDLLDQAARELDQAVQYRQTHPENK
jgi:hypothetical protein